MGKIVKYIIVYATFLLVLNTSNVVAEDKTSFYNNFPQKGLIDQKNQPFSPSALKGKVVLFNFIFTQCSNVCPLQLKALSQVKQSLPVSLNGKVKFVSVSLDPMHDTPKRLKDFSRKMHVDVDDWLFVTGNSDSIQKMIDRLRLFGNPAQQATVKIPNDHKTNLWLIDQHGHIMQQYRGQPVDKKRVGKEIEQLTQL